jgi:hypothetical protein
MRSLTPQADILPVPQQTGWKAAGQDRPKAYLPKPGDSRWKSGIFGKRMLP